MWWAPDSPVSIQIAVPDREMCGDAIRLQTLLFKDARQFRDLRDEHRAHYAVTRRSDRIVALPLALGASPIGEEKVVSVAEHASLYR